MDLNEIVSMEYDWIFRYSMRLCKNEMDAQDLAGDAILKILSNAESYDCSRPFRPWCAVIILNTYITRYNRNESVSFVGVGETFRCSQFRATDMLLIHEIRDAVQRCRKRSCSIDCVMLYADGYSYSEIAKRLNIPGGTVRSRISYGREMLMKVLDIQKVK